MKIEIEHSPKTEAKQIRHLVYSTATGFYIKNNWCVLEPKKEYYTYPKSVIVPRLNYQNLVIITSSKTGLKPKDYYKQKFSDEDLRNLEQAVAKDKSYKKLNKYKLSALKKEYIKLLEQAYKKTKTIEYLKKADLAVKIYPTLYGTKGSFNYVIPKNPVEQHVITLFPRLDQKPEYIIELFVSAIVRGFHNTIPQSHITWDQSEAVSDYLVQNIFGYKVFIGTLKDLKEHNNAKYIKNSLDYTKELGFGIEGMLEYHKETNKIFVLGRDRTTIFAPYELRLLRSLIENKNKTLTFDNITDELYHTNPDEKFSFWGIRKCVQRVRNKLEKLGIPRDTIKSVKGEGFKLCV